ncbi:hypothetical protein [Brucella sp. IR073]|uniref:hypothetical protein n=1 Tax=unclassified Brucella TaxID=2632610 RepID=UPI003B97D9A9
MDRDWKRQHSLWRRGGLSGLFAVIAQTALAATTYTVQQSAKTNELEISVERPAKAPVTSLVLRGARFGIAPQVEAPSCDGKPLVAAGKGRWKVPAECRNVSWKVPLEPSGAEPANAQRSLSMTNGVLLSEASSLPRLDDAGPEKLSLPPGQNFPAAKDGLPLPPAGKPPLFVLLGVNPAETRTADQIKLVYFFDNPAARSRVPDMAEHLAGLRWLRDRVPSDGPMRFSVLWLGVPKKLLSLGGAQGDGLLLVNYLASDTPEPFGKAMRLYVPLHEAMHQFAATGRKRPVWMEESLASYFAIRAVLAVTHDAAGAKALFERFKEGAKAFPEGLVAISSRVDETGDQMAGIGAFYTKGVAFWDAVNMAMEKAGGQSLESRLTVLVNTDFDGDKTPDRLRTLLGVPPEIWAPIQKQYLD